MERMTIKRGVQVQRLAAILRETNPERYEEKWSRNPKQEILAEDIDRIIKAVEEPLAEEAEVR